MENRVKCEWCGYYYDRLIDGDCPKCGGVNADSNKIILKDKEKHQNKFSHKIFIFLGIILVFSIVVIFIIGFINSVKNNVCPDCDSDLTIQEGFEVLDYDNPYWQCTECGTDIYHEGFFNDTTQFLLDNSFVERYYTDDYYIEYGDAKFFIPFIEYTHYDDDYMGDLSLSVNLDLEFYESDYGDHSIDFYLLSGDNKYRLIFDGYSFDSNIKNVKDILKIGGNSTLYARCELGGNYSRGMFDYLLLIIDEKEFKMPLRYTTVKEDYSYYDGDINLSEKISFNQNTLYLDNINYTVNGHNSTYLYMDVQTDLNNFNNNEIYLEMVDKQGNSYRLYEDKYFCNENNIFCFNDLLKNKVDESIYLSFNGYFDIYKIESLNVFIDGEKFEIDLNI